MGKYTELVSEIINNIGGKENVISLTHCVTRLRFKLKDESICNDDVIKNMDGVVTVMKSGGQYQVVIGNHVPDVFKEANAQLGISADAPAAKAEKAEKNEQIHQNISNAACRGPDPVFLPQEDGYGLFPLVQGKLG